MLAFPPRTEPAEKEWQTAAFMTYKTDSTEMRKEIWCNRRDGRGMSIMASGGLVEEKGLNTATIERSSVSEKEPPSPP